MSKTYIVSRNGGTVTKAPINDNKIPIYDSEQDVKADINNMSEDQLYGYPEPKFNIDDMKQYIRNQNVLSDVEVVSHPNTNQVTAEYDGFLIFTFGTQSTRTITVNGILWVDPISSSNITMSYVIPVKQGDVVLLTPSNDVYTALNIKARYYKLRDYTDR